MILASLLLPIAVVAIVLLVQRCSLPVFLAMMATVVGYGIAADMTFQSVGKAFGLGFVGGARTDRPAGGGRRAGRCPACCASRSAPARPPPPACWRGSARSAAGGLALLQPAGQDAPRRAIGLALTLLAFPALVTPSPLAVAAASVMKMPLADDGVGRACRSP